jgi:hypothetical protein
LHTADHRDDDTEEIMTTNVIEAAIGEASFAVLGGDEQTLLLLLTAQDAQDIRTRSQEDASIDAEDILVQADEALVVG